MSRWRSTKVKHVCQEVDVRHGEEDLPLLSVSIHRGVLPRSEMTDRVSRADDTSEYKRCLPNDIVLNRMRAFQGAIGISRSRGLVTPEYLVLRAGSAVAPRFLGYLFKSSWFVSEMSSRVQGIGTIDQGNVRTPRIYWDQLASIPLEMPEPAEQNAIADFLDRETARIDELVNRHNRTHALLEERLWAVAATLVVSGGRSGRLDPTGLVPARWREARLARFVVSITDGPFGSSLKSSHYAADGARVIRLGNIGRAVFKDEDQAFIPLDYYESMRRFEVGNGDLLIAGLGDKASPLARACVVPPDLGPAIIKADCFRVRLNQGELLHDYVAWFLSSPVGGQLAEAHSRGVTRLRINTDVAGTLPILVPSLEEQRAIVDELERLRVRTRTAQSLLDREVLLLAERRQALITAAVTGRYK